MKRRAASYLLAGLLLALTLPAVALTLARPWDSTTGVVIRLQALAPLGIPLHGLVLLLCLAGGLLRAKGRRAPLLGLALVAAAGLGVHLWWFAPQVSGDAPDAADGAATTRVMTANIYADAGDPVQVVEEASRAEVDVLVVQEITERALDRMDEAGLGELLPHRVGTPIGPAGTMVFADAPLGEPQRLATLFECWRVDVGALSVLAVHPAAPILPTGPEQWREDHRLILESVVEHDVDIVVGDLNASADHAVLRELEEVGLRDAAEITNEGWQPTWPATGWGAFSWVPPMIRLDHVLVGPQLTAVSTETVEIEGADHLAVVAEVADR